jgi:alpha-N-arabinofuranosidase
MLKGRIVVSADERIGTISPNVYGYFFENCGKSIYPGAWVGEDSGLPNEDGLRTDVLDALAALGPSAVRWPGGWYADFHHWRDGVGPREDRPVSLSPYTWDRDRRTYGSAEPNHFGVDEFMRFCRRINAEPYLCVNMVTGTVAEAFEWVEYCNFDGDTTLTRLRAQHGSPDPHRVRYWGLGNEPNCSPEDYARQFLRYGVAMKQADKNKDLELVAAVSGSDEIEWNRRVMEHLADYIRWVDHLSIHHYADGGLTVDFSDEQYYEQLACRFELDRRIKCVIQAADLFAAGRKSLGIVVDEWGRAGDIGERMWTQVNTFREAMLSALHFHVFHKYADRVVMANVSHMINVGHCLIYADRETIFKTPNYYVWEMYRPHKGANAVRVRSDSPVVKQWSQPREPIGFPPQSGAGSITTQLHALDASASIAPAGDQILITYLNQSLTDDVEIEVEFRDTDPVGDPELTVFQSDNVRDINTFENPNAVLPPYPGEAASDGRLVRAKAERHSINALTVKLK